MLGKFNKTEYFLTFGVDAFDVEVEVHSLESFAENRFDFLDIGPTAVRTLAVGLFGGPSRDATFAEEFSAGVAFVGLEDNLDADGAVERFVSSPYESVWVIASKVHFCWVE